MSSPFKYHFKSQKGFTLAELLVSIAIMAIITTVIVANQSGHNEDIQLKSIADSLSLTLREVQTYGVAVKDLGAGSNEFSDPYGVVFDLSHSGGNDAYLTFADRGGHNGFYNGGWSCPSGVGSECVSKTVLPGGFTVASVCNINAADLTDCVTANHLEVLFQRPSLEARIKFYSDSSLVSFGSSKGGKIVLASPSGKTRSVTVYNTGSISVQ